MNNVKDQDQKNKKLTLRLMVVLIIMFMAGIVLRWQYIAGEAAQAWKNLFGESVG